MTQGQLANIVRGSFPRLPYPAALQIVTKAFRDVADEKIWSWQFKEGILYAPPNITTGNVSVTQYNKTITFDATARADINTSNSDLVDLAPVVGRQFRIGQDGHIYTIISYVSGTGVAVLDRAFVGITNASAVYSMYKAYYESPTGKDFKRFETVIDPDNSYLLRTDWTKEEIDAKDPQRQAFGDAYRICSHDVNQATGLQRFEMWPHNQNERGYVCQIITLGFTDFAGVSIGDPAFQFPQTLDPATVVEARALYHAAMWAAANVGQYVELQKTNWTFVAGEHKAFYREKVIDAKKNDGEIFLTSWIIPPGGRFGSPVDASFAQRHDTSFF